MTTFNDKELQILFRALRVAKDDWDGHANDEGAGKHLTQRERRNYANDARSAGRLIARLERLLSTGEGAKS